MLIVNPITMTYRCSKAQSVAGTYLAPARKPMLTKAVLMQRHSGYLSELPCRFCAAVLFDFVEQQIWSELMTRWSETTAAQGGTRMRWWQHKANDSCEGRRTEYVAEFPGAIHVETNWPVTSDPKGRAPGCVLEIVVTEIITRLTLSLLILVAVFCTFARIHRINETVEERFDLFCVFKSRNPIIYLSI